MEKQEFICINNISDSRFVVLQNYNAEGIPTYIDYKYALTIGKTYQLLNITLSNIKVTNDIGKEVKYPRELFKKLTLQDKRNMFLDKLLK